MHWQHRLESHGFIICSYLVKRMFKTVLGMPFAGMLLLLLLVPPLALATPLSSTNPQTNAKRTYVLNVGDTIQINVLGQPGLSFKTRLTGDGTMDYPFLGRIQIAGNSVRAVQRIITRGLKNGYLVDPQVRVSVIAFRPIYVRGAVNRPGAYPYSIGMTVGNAIAAAGGLNIRASKDEIYILPEETPPDRRQQARMGTEISPGETIIVEESFF